MPEWLIELLKKQGSQGMTDSLMTLVGAHPIFSQLPKDQQNYRVGNQQYTRLGETTADAHGQPMIALNPLLLSQYDSPLPRGYRGADYHSTDSSVRLGDAVIEHEFGHIATNTQTLAGLADVTPDATDEVMADHFQNAFQFLRSHKTDTTNLDPTTQKVVDVLLASPLYENHPINQVRARSAQLKLLAGKPPT